MAGRQDIRQYLEAIGILDGEDNLATNALANILDVNDDVESEHLDNATKDPGSTTSNIPAFGSWTQLSADRPAFVQLEVRVETDGAAQGDIAVDIDEDGDDVADDTFDKSAPATLAAGEGRNLQMLLYVPAGGQYQVRNVNDPNTANSIEVANEIVG